LVSAAGMDDRSGATLACSTMTHVHSLWLTRGDYPKRAAMALCCSLHRLLPESLCSSLPLSSLVGSLSSR
jgi:hypothetical protein